MPRPVCISSGGARARGLEARQLALDLRRGQHHLVAPAALGQQQRPVGAVQQLVAVQRLAPVGNATEALQAALHNAGAGLRHHRAQALGRLHGPGLVHPGQHHHELVATDAPQAVVGANSVATPVATLLAAAGRPRGGPAGR